MKISVFTSNQPRHLSLIARLAEIADTVYAIQECNTVFPGAVDDFFRRSPIMQEYFSRVIAAEQEVFGNIRFSPPNVRSLSVKGGDVSNLDLNILRDALEADVITVFGASWIREPLVDALIDRRAINVHMGVSPYYRGSSCNFWALYDENADLVGATIHLLARGLDSGDMLFHALPERRAVDPFLLGMQAVRAAHRSLTKAIAEGGISTLEPVAQDKNQELRYTRNRDFTDQVAKAYLARDIGEEEVAAMLSGSPERDLLRPQFC